MNNKMGDNENLGQVKISEDVIAVLADKAVREVDGVADMSGSFVGSVVAALGKKSVSKGIDIELKDTIVTIGLHIIVKYGVKIPDVAWNAQEAVKSAVECMTGLTVAKVNVIVENVHFETTSSDEDACDCECDGSCCGSAKEDEQE